MARRRALPLPPSRCNKSEAKGKTATLSSKRGAERHVQAIAAGKLYRDKRGHFNLRNLLDMHVQSTLIYWTGEEKRRGREGVKRRPIRRENRIDIEAGHGEGTTCAGQPTKGTTLLSLSLSLWSEAVNICPCPVTERWTVTSSIISYIPPVKPDVKFRPFPAQTRPPCTLHIIHLIHVRSLTSIPCFSFSTYLARGGASRLARFE